MSDGQERRRAAITVRVDFTKDGFAVSVGDVMRVSDVEGGGSLAQFWAPAKSCGTPLAVLAYVKAEIVRRIEEVATAAGPGPLFRERTKETG